MRPRTRHATVFVLGACLLAAGCGGPPNTATDPPDVSAGQSAPADPAAAAWAGSFCTTVGRLVRSVHDAAPAANTTDPGELKAAFATQLRTTADSLGETAKDLDGLPSSPIGDGDRVVDTLATKFTGLVDTFERAESAMNAAKPEMADIGRVMAEVGPISAALTSRPLNDVAVSPEFKSAGAQAAKCRTEPWWSLVGR